MSGLIYQNQLARALASPCLCGSGGRGQRWRSRLLFHGRKLGVVLGYRGSTIRQLHYQCGYFLCRLRLVHPCQPLFLVVRAPGGRARSGQMPQRAVELSTRRGSLPMNHTANGS